MDVRTMSLFFAMLTVVAQIGVLAMAASPRVRELVRPAALRIAWLVAVVAMAGSLYYSEVVGFVPCELCWYQRIAIYPMVFLLGVAALRRAGDVWRYALPLNVVGALISIYHYQLQRFPQQASVTCDAEAPCSVTWVWQFHYISIPMMALTVSVTIAVLVVVARRDRTAA